MVMRDFFFSRKSEQQMLWEKEKGGERTQCQKQGPRPRKLIEIGKNTLSKSMAIKRRRKTFRAKRVYLYIQTACPTVT